jgi:hypothetical protein
MLGKRKLELVIKGPPGGDCCCGLGQERQGLPILQGDLCAQGGGWGGLQHHCSKCVAECMLLPMLVITDDHAE